MNIQYLFSPSNIRQGDNDLSIKTSGPQQSWVKDIWPIRRSNDDDAIIRFKSIHLDQQLIERLFALVVTATQARSPMAAHRVDFINKNDARSLFLALFKHIAYARGTDTDKHLDKVRARYRKKGNFCFAGYCLSKQGLSRSRRANH